MPEGIKQMEESRMVDTKKLEQAAARLNKQSDSLNETLQKIQDKVNSFNIGIEVWRKDDIHSEDVPSELGDKMLEYHLGYAKFPEGWGFAIQLKEAQYRRDENGEWEFAGRHPLSKPTPLLKASREVRIAALQHLPSLIEGLQEKAEEAVSKIEKARQLADEL
jgi:hypothetical protein